MRAIEMQAKWKEWANVAPERFHFYSDGTVLPIIAGGKGETTVTTVVPPKTQDELDLIKKQNELLTVQLDEVKRQSAAYAEVYPQQKQLLQAQVDVAIQQTELFKKTIGLFEEEAESPVQKEIRELSEQKALATLKGEALPLSPQQEAQIEQYYGAAETEGQRSIRQFGEELAASRGMTLADSPIGAEVLRREKEFQQSLEGAKAGAKLNVGQAQQGFAESVRQFQENLRLQAYQNRLSLLGRGTGTSALSTTSTGGVSQNISNLLNTLSAERLGTATKTQSGAGFDVTSLFAPAATLGAALITSSARYKRNIRPLDKDEYSKALARVRATPITRYRYKWEEDRGEPHIGPILELAPPEITDDGKTVNLLDYSGLLHASLKAVDRRVSELGRILVEMTKEPSHATV